MQPKLQNRRDATTALVLKGGERIEIPRVDDEWFLADDVGADSQGKADVRVVKIVGRADAQVVDAIRFRSALQLADEPVKSFRLEKKARAEREPIKHADRVTRIQRCDEPVSRVVEGLKMARRYVTGNTRNRKVLHNRAHSVPLGYMPR